MSYPPTTVLATYLTYSNADPAAITTATVTLTIPTGSNYSDYLMGIVRAGGIFFPQNAAANPPAQITFIPIQQIVSMVAS